MGAGAILCAAVGADAAARTVDAPPAPAAPAGGRMVYDQGFFAQYNVSNAEDMLRLIPGAPAVLDAQSDQQERGFGGGGAPVLINGRRFPGKANDIRTSLRRIPAANVERVELISGASEGLPVQSEGIVLNVVLREGASLGGAGTWEANLRASDNGRIEQDGLLSYSGSLGGLSYSASVQLDAWAPGGQHRWGEKSRDEAYYGPDGALLELRPQSWRRDHDRWIYTAGLTYDFQSGDRAQLNAYYDTIDMVDEDRTAFTRFDPQGQPILLGEDVHRSGIETRRTLELSGEYERRIGPGGLHVLALARREKDPTTELRDQIIGGRTIEISRSASHVETDEAILRATYRFRLRPDHALEVGGEIARNTLDQRLRVFFDENDDGRVEEVIVPTGTAHVAESRGEAFATHWWTIGRGVTLESTITYEASRITNNYPFSPERQLAFVKPRFDLRYRRSPAEQYRLLLERTVSQLDFANFVPRYDFEDDEVDAGNPGLSPEKTWTLEAGYERRLPSDAGLLEARVFYSRITDAIDKVLLVDSHGAYYSAEGNLPKASLYGAEAKFSVRLGQLGLPNALLSGRFLRQESRVADPFTGETRRLKSDRGYGWDVSFRHDLPAWSAAYGLTYTRYGWAALSSDLFVRNYFWIGPTLDAFVEKRLNRSATLRLEIQNLNGAIERRRRQLFAESAMDGRLRRYERYQENRDMRIALRLRGRF
jgi:hypothetical protein